MRIGDKKIFTGNPNLLAQMVDLRLNQGFSTVNLAAYFNCDINTIIYQLKKMGVYKKKNTREKQTCRKYEIFQSNFTKVY